jgi:peptidyl-prolyl cis-trans isomerase SurA
MILKFLNKVKIVFLLLCMHSNGLFSQELVLDEVVAVVASQPIKISDITNMKRQLKEQAGEESVIYTDCEVLEQLLFQKLLIYQAQVDSVEVTEKQIEQELDKRIRYFTQQLGSEQKLEEFYNKSIAEIKDEFREKIKEQLLTQTMQGKITAGLTVTPVEVRNFYRSLPSDSIPFINAEVEVARIMKSPPVSEQEKKLVKEKLEKLRERIIAGADFSAMAALYSEDPGSAAKGGELGFMGRGMLVPEFEAVAFELKPGEVSRIVETQFGFHVIQLIERLGEQFNCRHILLVPKTSGADLYKAQQSLDSIYNNLLNNKSISFEKACAQFSDDAETKYNGGLIVNPATGNTRFEMNELDRQIFFAVDKLNIGEFSKPLSYQTPDGKKAYQILYLKTKTDAHQANLKDDYQRLQNAALQQKQSNAVNDWIKKKKRSTYIQIDERFKNCVFKNSWL